MYPILRDGIEIDLKEGPNSELQWYLCDKDKGHEYAVTEKELDGMYLATGNKPIKDISSKRIKFFIKKGVLQTSPLYFKNFSYYSLTIPLHNPSKIVQYFSKILFNHIGTISFAALFIGTCSLLYRSSFSLLSINVPFILLVSLISTVVHEFGHAIGHISHKGAVKYIKLYFKFFFSSGGSTYYSDNSTRKKDKIHSCFGGIAFSLIFFCILSLVRLVYFPLYSSLSFLAYYELYLIITNLIPSPYSDGERILSLLADVQSFGYLVKKVSQGKKNQVLKKMPPDTRKKYLYFFKVCNILINGNRVILTHSQRVATSLLSFIVLYQLFHCIL